MLFSNSSTKRKCDNIRASSKEMVFELRKEIANLLKIGKKFNSELCVYCDEAVALKKRCVTCKALYCSVDCQRLDWPTHKHECRKAEVSTKHQGGVDYKNCCRTCLVSRGKMKLHFCSKCKDSNWRYCCKECLLDNWFVEHKEKCSRKI